MTVITAGVPGENEASGILSLRFEQLARRLDARGVDLGGTRSLEARCIRKIADERNARARAQRQKVALVAQERDRLRGNTRSQLMVLVQVVGSGRRQASARARDVEDLLGTRVDVDRIQFSSLNRLDNLTRTSKAGSGHLEATTGAHRCDGAVRTTPIGDDHAVKTPLGAQDVGEQVLVLVGVGTVDEVVGAHDHPWLRTSAHDLEAGQVDLAHRALVHDGIRGHAAQFLRVDSEVLGAGGGSRRLNSLDEARCHASCKDRILGKVLEVTSAQGRALDVEARAEQDVDAESPRLQSECLAHLAGQVRIPGGCNGRRSRETGRLLRLRDAQVVGVAELAAHAMRAVTHDKGRDIRSGDRARVPGTRSRQKSRRLQEGQIIGVRQCLVFHRRELPFVLHRGYRR